MIKVLVLIIIIIATVIEVENRKHKVLKHRHKHALRESRPERDAGGIQLKPEATRNKLFPGYGTNFRYMSCHHSLGATGATLNTRNASS